MPESPTALRSLFLAATLAACGSDVGPLFSDSSSGGTGNAGAAGSASSTGGTSAVEDGGSSGSGAPGGNSSGGSASAGAGGSSGGPGGGEAGSGAGGAGSGGSVAVGGSGQGPGPEPQPGDLWISTSGDDSNPGTQESPLRSLDLALEKVVPGQTIWMAAGTYGYSNTIELTASGTAAEPLRLAGAPGGARPVLDFEGVAPGGRGLQLEGDHWHLRDMEIQNAADNCVHVSGSDNTLELIAVHDCGDTGIQISGSSGRVPEDNSVINCDSYRNADASAEDADGFAAKLGVGPGNRFYGCRAWHNADDGWDLYDARAVVTIESCWAFAAEHPTLSQANSDGNGFKLGGQREKAWYDESATLQATYPTYQDYVAANELGHSVVDSFAFHNPSTGFDRNNNPSSNITCTGCGAWGNGDDVSAGIKVVGELEVLPAVTPELAIAAARDAGGNLPDIQTLP